MSKTQCLLLAVAVAAMGFTFGCSSGGDGGGGSGGGGGASNAGCKTYDGSYGSFTDERDSKEYKTVVIGAQTWMAENLNYNKSNSICYNNQPSNCTTYGRLYDWETAIDACPGGWHLPTNEEWNSLIGHAGGEDIAAVRLKATSGWGSGNGANCYGFSAEAGGAGASMAGMVLDSKQAGEVGTWWSATEYGSDNAYRFSMDYRLDNTHSDNISTKSIMVMSVRCIKD